MVISNDFQSNESCEWYGPLETSSNAIDLFQPEKSSEPMFPPIKGAIHIDDDSNGS